MKHLENLGAVHKAQVSGRHFEILTGKLLVDLKFRQDLLTKLYMLQSVENYPHYPTVWNDIIM